MLHTEKEHQEAWADGVVARQEGKPLAACPYLDGHLRLKWERGWLNEDRALRTGN
jgi:ribosome modulation factor